MRILLIAYEFPPSPSPQSLRWAYLTRELAALGHEVHVLTPDIGPSIDSWPLLPEMIRIHRTFAGPFRGLLKTLVSWRRRSHAAATQADATRVSASATGQPKYRLLGFLQRAVATLLFPDERGEWRPFAARRLRLVLQRLRPDVVVASHEPATSLQLGLLARRQGFPLVADLGDPVLTAYTPRHWRNKAHHLEREICARAQQVIVTSAATAQLLAQRHGGGVRVSVLTQGFDDHARAPDANANANAIFDPARLELLYTGNFYRFRRPDALLEAVRALGGMRLNVATSSAPRALLQACRDAPERFRQLGFLSHADALALQRQADVLVHIANDDPVQVPGKLFEYLGAGRPVLYIGEPGCEAARILAAAQACWIVDNHAERIRTTLAEILDRKREGELPMCAPASAYGWSRIAARLEGVLAAAVHAAASGGGNVDPTRPNSA